MVFGSVTSFTATISTSPRARLMAARTTVRPIRPNPLMPTRTAIWSPLRRTRDEHIHSRRAVVATCPGRAVGDDRPGGPAAVRTGPRGGAADVDHAAHGSWARIRGGGPKT